MHELDEFLQHSGIKGMKWGVRRNSNGPGGADGKPDTSSQKYTKDNLKTDRKAINARARSGEITKRQAMKERVNNLHKLRLDTSKVYNKKYNKQIGKGRSHKRAIAVAQRALNSRSDLKIAATVTAIGLGAKVAKIGYNVAMSEAGIRTGKNIILAATGSNLRYASASMIRNVVN